MCPIGSVECGPKFELPSDNSSWSGKSDDAACCPACDATQRQVEQTTSEGGSRRSSGPKRFFGVLSNLNWEDAESGAESRIRHKLEWGGELASSPSDSDDETVNDIDALLESVIRLASEGTAPTAAVPQHRHQTIPVPAVSSLAQASPVTEPFEGGIMGIDTAGLDLSVAPLASLTERDENADIRTESAQQAPHSNADFWPRYQDTAVRSIEPLASSVTASPGQPSMNRVLWFGLGAALSGTILLLLHHSSSVTGARSSPAPIAPLAAAPWTSPSSAMPVAPVQALDPQPVVTAEQLPLAENPPTTRLVSVTSVEPNPVISVSELETPETAVGAAPFDADAAASALEVAAQRASSCRQAADQPGIAIVSVTLAPSGRVTTAVIAAPPFMGTATGSCVATAMRDVHVPPFVGTFRTVTKLVTVR